MAGTIVALAAANRYSGLAVSDRRIIVDFAASRAKHIDPEPVIINDIVGYQGPPGDFIFYADKVVEDGRLCDNRVLVIYIEPNSRTQIIVGQML
jgi:hypothetical protein